ncbi:hypothetical protein ACF068_14535 [Streptomyces sp. NPDC016309]|uniref:hypothetical protein n=1 Tax=Streptomyces sp. NPDC016309 TaxID=3364965 RepID=UPI0036FDD45C
MPLYEHTSGEREQTVPDSRRDKTLAASEAWTVVEESAPADEPQPAEEAAAVEAQPVRVTKRTAKPAAAEEPAAPAEG